jgi:hypothetical protein
LLERELQERGGAKLEALTMDRLAGRCDWVDRELRSLTSKARDHGLSVGRVGG